MLLHQVLREVGYAAPGTPGLSAIVARNMLIRRTGPNRHELLTYPDHLGV